MRKKIIHINIKIIMIIISIIAILIAIILKKSRDNADEIMYTKIESINYSKELIINKDEEKEKTKNKIELKEYQNMPQDMKGYKIIGKIESEKINLNQYILEETNKKTLNVSVTKLYGPKINNIGNFCIIGHNYINSKMFGNIKKLEIGDIIKITDTYDRTIEYKVYDIYTTNPKDTSCLSQQTQGEREITLITCTFTGLNRLIVKAVECYD